MLNISVITRLHAHLMMNLLTPLSKVILEKLTATQPTTGPYSETFVYR